MWLTVLQHFSTRHAVLSRKYHKIWMFLHCWGCGAEQDLIQSHSSSVVPVPAGSIGCSQHTKAWSRARDHPRNPPRAEGHQVRERAAAFTPMALLGKGLTAPGSAEMELLGRAGWRLGWTRKCPQAPNIFLYRNGLEKLYNLIRVIIVPQKTQAWANHLWTDLPW